MSDFAEIGKIPATIFSGMPTDQLAPADPTAITDELPPLNNYKRSLVGGTKSILKAIPGSEAVSSAASSLADTAKDFSEKPAVQSLIDKIPALSDKVRRNLLNANTINRLQNANSTSDYLTIAGNVLEVSPANKEMIVALDDIYKTVSDKNTFKRLAANAQDALVAIGIDIAGSYGFGPLAELLIDELKDHRQQRKAWSQTFYSYAPSSDLDVLIKSIQKGGLASIYALTDSPIRHVLNTFRFDLTKYGTVSANTTKLIQLLELIDPQWLKYEAYDQTFYNLDNLKDISQDALIAFDTIDEIRPFSRGAKEIGKKRSREVMRSTYPILGQLMR